MGVGYRPFREGDAPCPPARRRVALGLSIDNSTRPDSMVEGGQPHINGQSDRRHRDQRHSRQITRPGNMHENVPIRPWAKPTRT